MRATEASERKHGRNPKRQCVYVSAGKWSGINISLGEKGVVAPAANDVVELPISVDNHTVLPELTLQLVDAYGCHTVPDFR